MVGKKGRSGPKRKPTQEHLMNGTFRADRHGNNCEPVFDGTVEKPAAMELLDDYGDELWEQFIAPAMAKGIITSIDHIAVMALVEHYGAYRRAAALAERTDHWRDHATRRANWAEFAKLASDFGLTPVARAGLSVPPPAKDPNEVDILSFGRD